MQLSPARLLEYSGILEIHWGDGFRDWLHGILDSGGQAEAKQDMNH